MDAKTRTGGPYIGRPMPRFEDLRLVRGNGRYSDDISMPDQVYAVFVRSPHANAKITSIKTQAAAGAAGFVAPESAKAQAPQQRAAAPPSAAQVAAEGRPDRDLAGRVHVDRDVGPVVVPDRRDGERGDGLRRAPLAVDHLDLGCGSGVQSLFLNAERIVATDVISPVHVPPHDNSAMDGYAFDGSVLSAGGAIGLRCVGTALAGPVWQGQVRAGECIKIMTGAVMPAGLNTVVPAEFTRVEGEQVVFEAASVRAGDNRRECGEDIRQGQVALPQGTRLGPAALGLLASLGIPTVRVYPRLRVAYFSTGSEILSLGDAPREGAVYDSNRYTVMGMLHRLGCEMKIGRAHV